MSKILITGATGLLGSACVNLFYEKKWQVVAIDNNMRHKFFGTPDKWFVNEWELPVVQDPPLPLVSQRMDIRNKEGIESLFKEHAFDAIIHAAAQPSHDYSTDHLMEDFEINTIGTLNLLEATRKYSPDAAFVYVSTDKVYGENWASRYPLEEYETRYEPNIIRLRQGVPETMPLDYAGHRSFFGCSKVAADLYAQEYANEFGMKIGIFRPGCITGKNHEGAEQHGFLAYLAKCIKEGKTYNIYGYKGKQVRDQIHAVDVASAFSAFIQSPRSGSVYNIGGGPNRSVSVLEAMEMIASETGRMPKIELHEARKGDRQWDVHDVSKFRADYPEWDYQYSLQDIIKDICSK